MSIIGTFGYIIGKKKYMMRVDEHGDLLWQILVREIYVLMKHYGSIDDFESAFKSVKSVKVAKPPTATDIESCKLFKDFQSLPPDSWKSLLHHCQGSFINILVSGYIPNEKEEKGLVFLLDFNKKIVKYYDREDNKPCVAMATIEEIMEYEDMPQKSYIDIINETRERFNIWHDKYSKVNEELQKLYDLKRKTQSQCARNIEEKVDRLIDDMENEKEKLLNNQRVFYNRLKILDLIEE